MTRGQRFRYHDPGNTEWHDTILVYRGNHNEFYIEKYGDSIMGWCTVHDDEYDNLVPLSLCPMEVAHEGR